jgi:gliding motility-associated-like protein
MVMKLARVYKLKVYALVAVWSILASSVISAQFSASISSTLNYKCNGLPCDYNGPSILINELMISPSVGDGSISGPGPNGGLGEWIELYNPDLCESVDISCYYLGNYTYEGAGGFRIPTGTVVPPSGFCLVRGVTAPAVPADRLVQNGGNVVEIVVPNIINGTGVCCTGNRVWFPNLGGWFAFYDQNGVPQDAVSWGAGNANDVNFQPCVPFRSGCSSAPSLSSYTNIPSDRKTKVTNVDAGSHIGLSIRRIPDGGAWNNYGPPTLADCNAACIPPGESTCDGTATVTVSGGTPPFSFQWNDPVGQTTQTAIELCAGNYLVVITDANGNTTQANVTILDFVPDVSLDLANSYCLNAPPVNLSGQSPVAGVNESGVFQGSGVTGSQFIPANAGVGTHTITYTFTDEFDCSNFSTDEIIVLDIPSLSVENVAIYCVDETQTDFQFTPSGGTLSGNGTQNNQFNPSIAGVGVHQLTYSYTDNNGCNNTLDFEVQVVGIPNLSINAPASICVNEADFELTGNPNGGDFSINSIPSSVFSPGDLGVGTHEVYYEYFDEFGCFSSTTAEVLVAPIPEIGFYPEYQESCPPLAVSFFAETSPVVSCLWDFGDGTVSTTCSAVNHVYTQSGCYDVSISVVSAEGCSNTAIASEIVCIHPVPVANFAFTPDPVSEFYTDVDFINLTTDGDIYFWSMVGGFPSNSSEIHPSTTYPPEIPGTYPVQLIAISDKGCVDTIQRDVIVFPDVLVYVPNTFTPDDNQHNNVWQPSIIGLRDEGFELLVFNRWGELIWETQDLHAFWDGTYNNIRVKEGTYVWKMKGIQRHSQEEFQWNGHVNVLY